ncbi:MAG: hypothetical protein LBS60_14600 [Deltaproteobacteria bacterium]|jgi:hypothetical protein|nr:hypothetical protein [Deltaproteobacteria bacterium]
MPTVTLQFNEAKVSLIYLIFLVLIIVVSIIYYFLEKKALKKFKEKKKEYDALVAQHEKTLSNALIKCPDCGAEVSNKAQACPKCGCPINNKKTLDFWAKWDIIEINTQKRIADWFEKLSVGCWLAWIFEDHNYALLLSLFFFYMSYRLTSKYSNIEVNKEES